MAMRYICILYLICFLPFTVLGQDEAKTRESVFYGGLHLGTPLFWGDLYSFGDKTRLGYGGGLLGGVQLNQWVGAELNIDYAIGRLGTRSWQVNDLLDEHGIIRYRSGSHRLGDLYSETRFFRTGIRIPIQLLNLLTGTDQAFNLELAPHYYLNKFDPNIKDRDTKEILPTGARPKNWSHSLGGDFAMNYRMSPRSHIFLRTSLSWLADDQFEGIRTIPAWRVNLNLYTSIGVRLAFGKKTVNTPVSTATLVSPNGNTYISLPKTNANEQESVPITTPISNADSIGKESLNAITPTTKSSEKLPTIYFKLNSSVLDVELHKTQLNRIIQSAIKSIDYTIQIEGWTDPSGPAIFNKRLALERAKSVANYLISAGIDPARIYYVGMGIDRSQRNFKDARRVEITIIFDQDKKD